MGLWMGDFNMEEGGGEATDRQSARGAMLRSYAACCVRAPRVHPPSRGGSKTPTHAIVCPRRAASSYIGCGAQHRSHTR